MVGAESGIKNYGEVVADDHEIAARSAKARAAARAAEEAEEAGFSSATIDAQSQELLLEKFRDFNSFGVSAGTSLDEMDGKHWMKFCQDTKLLDKKRFTNASVDLVFTKVKQMGSRKINFRQFLQAIRHVAMTKQEPLDDIVEQLVYAQSGPSSSGTKALKNKFHDDPALYTGVHARGGPETNDNRITLQNMVADRPSNKHVPAF